MVDDTSLTITGTIGLNDDTISAYGLAPASFSGLIYWLLFQQATCLIKL
jgi:hypothetical protein